MKKKFICFILSFILVFSFINESNAESKELYFSFKVSGKTYDVPRNDLIQSYTQVYKLTKTPTKYEYTYKQNKYGKVKVNRIKKGSYYVYSGKRVKCKIKGKSFYCKVVQEVKKIKVKKNGATVYVLDKDTKYQDILIKESLLKDSGIGITVGQGFLNSRDYGVSPKTYCYTGSLSGGLVKLLKALKTGSTTSISSKYKKIGIPVNIK